MQILPVALAANKEKYSTFFIHLVSLYLQNTTLRFAVVDQDITFGGVVFTAFPVRIGAIKNTIDTKRDSINITLSDVTNAFKIALLRGEDFRGCRMEIIRISYPESLTDDTQYQGVFVGELDSPKLDDSKSEFSCVARDIVSNYETGRTLMYPCNNQFGDEDCGIVKETVVGAVQPGSTANTVVLQSSYADNHWAYGFITANGQSLAIIASAGNTVTPEYPFYTTPAGKYTLTSGCNMGFDFCKSRYNNRKNYSGAPAIPWENIVKT
jgi:hypothetical protein